MTTNSIFHNIIIDSEKELVELLNVLEEAERLANTSDNEKEIMNNVKTLTQDKIKTLFKKINDKK
ncbi:hypothetical protein ACTQX2_00405 [Megamonas funiformis]|uniref:hypothetical protein n=1 Tax=Megamonas funiformis TaxID=437897 RepID=UPI003F9BB26A